MGSQEAERATANAAEPAWLTAERLGNNMSEEADDEGYFLVAKRKDPETGTPFEFWAKLSMTDAQIEEMFDHSRSGAKLRSPDYRDDAIEVWVEDAYFDQS